jgi:hypothetical protein
MTSRRGPRSVSRASTPSDTGDWSTRLRATSVRLEDAPPPPSPTKVTRGRAAPSRTSVLRGSIVGSVAGSIAGSDAGSNDSYTRGRASGNKSRNARSGTTGNTYGTGAAAQSSQMSAQGTLTGLSGAMSSELRVQTLTQRPESSRAHREDPDEPNPDRPLGPGVPPFPGQILEPVREESERPDTSKSYGPAHEYGMGHVDGRNKSFSEAHEAGMASRFNREPTPYHARNSPSSRSSPEPAIEPEQKQEPELVRMSRGLRSCNWLKQHHFAILSGLLLTLAGTLLYAFGPAMLEQMKRVTAPTMLPNGVTPATVTVTTHVHDVETTTVTLVKETSIVKIPSVQDRRNFFNVEIGAHIDDRLTSSTRAPKRSWYGSIFGPIGSYWGGPFTDPDVKPALTAIQPWTETGQCWCASSSDLGLGQMQLGVHLPIILKPDAITLEHQPHHLSLDAKNAPRHMEIWAEVLATEGEAPEPGCVSEPPPVGGEWTCLGRMEFKQFNTAEKAQRLDLQNPYVHTKRVVIQVTENWGRDYTCLYRVQLHGEMVSTLHGGAIIE